MKLKIGIIGSGFSGLSAASYAAKSGHDVTVFEQHDQLGGRARAFSQDGFLFDMGPSWYWMPEVFENFFRDFGSSAADHYELKRLDPSYRVFFEGEQIDVGAGRESYIDLAEKLDPGSGRRVEKFLNDARYKYDTAMGGFVQKPSLSVTEFASLIYLRKAWKMNLLGSIRKEISKVTTEKRLQSLLEFPVLFLGSTPAKIPAMYSMMNYADIDLGTWYPMGGMHKIVDGFERIARSQGVKFRLRAKAEAITVKDEKIDRLVVNGVAETFDAIISGADYAHTEKLLPARARVYSDNYWNNRTFAPSCLLYYVGVRGKVNGLLHHNLFFDADFDRHAAEIYESHQWPESPLFYVCAPSKTDPDVAPEGDENLFILIPVSTRIEDTPEIRERYFEMVLKRISALTGEDISDRIVLKKSYARSNFIEDYNAFGGNAYGLANTLLQTAFLKPRMQSARVPNLYFTGQLTVPGPGVPPAIISGKTVAELINRHQST